MNPIDSKTAILFFSRSPVTETDHKVVYPGDKQKNRAIIELLYKNSLKQISGSGLDVIAFDENRQQGATFGERFANAFKQLFEEGYDQVISVGNDCPAIGQVQWASICKLLDSGESVIGPTPAGGAYLIALTADQFSYEPFKQLPWQSSRLLQQLITYVKGRNQALRLLRYRVDINRLYDARAYLKTPLSFGDKRLRQLLSKIIGIQHKSAFHLTTQFDAFTSAASTRAPPRI